MTVEIRVAEFKSRKDEIEKLKIELETKLKSFDEDFKTWMENSFGLQKDQQFHILDIIIGARKL